jgi:CRP/FNR family cyclic AMP-dependent transcriptional regulator
MDAARLATIPLFRDLSHHDRERIAAWADEVDVAPGYHLVDQGRWPHEFFVITEGEVDVTRDGEHLATLGPGDFFGEIALVEHDRRTASVVAKTPLRVIVMFPREFEAMRSAMPEVAAKIMATISARPH